MTVNFSATFKKDERINNGLEAIVRSLIKDPLERHVVVGVIECTRITRDIADGGVETPTVRFVMVEALDGDAAEHARRLLDVAHNQRTGRAPQPALFGDPDDGDPIDATVWCGATDGEGRECALPEHDDATEHQWRDRDAEPERDPTAGPWPGDPDYVAPDSVDESSADEAKAAEA